MLGGDSLIGGGLVGDESGATTAGDDVTLYTSNPPFNDSDVIAFGESTAGVNLTIYPSSPYGPTDVLLETASFTQSTSKNLAMSSAGGATCTFGASVTRFAQSTANGVGHVTDYLGSPAHVTSTSNGQGGCTSNYLGAPFHITSTSNGVAAFTSNYLGSPFHITCTANGVGHMVNYLGTPILIACTAAGIAHWTSNYVSSAVPLGTTTSNGVSTATAYLGSPFHIASTAAGRAGCTANYLGSAAHISMTSHGVAGGTQYLSSPMRMTATSDGRAGCTSNYLGGPVRLTCFVNGLGQMYIGAELSIFSTAHGVATCDIDAGPKLLSATTSNGVGGVTSNYLGSPLRMQCASHGVATLANYLAGPVPLTIAVNGVGHVTLYLSGPTDLNGFYILAHATVTAYLAGPTSMTVTSNGVGHLDISSDRVFMISHGVASTTALMGSHGGNFATTITAGCLPYGSHNLTPALAFDLWGGHVSMSLTPIEGKATFIWGFPEFAFVCNAGCRAFGDGRSTPFYGVIFTYFGGVFAQLDNNSEVTHQPLVSGPSKMKGGATVTIGTANSAMFIVAGCVAFDTYPADKVLQPPFYRRGTGPDFHPSENLPVPGGVFAVMFAPHTYLETNVDKSGSTRDPFTLETNGVRIYLSSPVRYNATSNGIAHFTVAREATIAFHGVGGFDDNHINVPSYDIQSFQSDGIANAYLTSPEDRTLTATSHGVGHVDAYVSSRVYFDATAHGRAGCTHNELLSDTFTANGGCYPYYIVTTLHPGVEIAMDKPARALVLTTHGIANVTAEVVGPKQFTFLTHGIGHMVSGLQNNIGKFSMTINAGSKLHGVPEGTPGGFYTIDGYVAYGVIMTLVPDPHWADFNGVGHMNDVTLNYTFILRWQQRGDPPLAYGALPPFGNKGTLAEGGVGGMILETRWFLSMTTKTNIDYFNETYPPGRYLYPPDAWSMNAIWALESRSRGRTRMYFDFNQIAGNLLALFFSIPQPWEPNIDGDTSLSGMKGQFWPRAIKLPFRNVEPASHPYIWRDFEYWRR